MPPIHTDIRLANGSITQRVAAEPLRLTPCLLTTRGLSSTVGRKSCAKVAPPLTYGGWISGSDAANQAGFPFRLTSRSEGVTLPQD